MLSCKGLSVRRELGQNFSDMGTAVTKAGWTDQAAQLDFYLACECRSLEPRVELRGSAWLSALQTLPPAVGSALLLLGLDFRNSRDKKSGVCGLEVAWL